ncbi:hypothetical protein, partial [Neisseria cinerea]|uniref:hypothetical protein n=1 Tax=Neisseria cinerea TaxID=483 RepID=UPI003C7EA205
MLRLAVNFDRDYFLTGSKLYPYLPRVWLHHTPRLQAAQTLKPMCRLKPTRMRAVHTRSAVQTIVLNFISKYHSLLYLEKME